MNSFNKLDQYWTVFLNTRLHNDLLDSVMIGLSSDWTYILIGSIILMAAFVLKKPSLIMILAFAIACAGMADYLSYEWLKPFFSRLRPCHVLGLGIRIVDHCGGQYGFPSNHATNAMASAGFVFFSIKHPVRYLFMAIAVLVGFSRVYLGVHFVGDVCAGFILGLSCAFIFSRCVQLFKNRLLS